MREKNNWDLVRLCLSTIVVAYHSLAMSGLPAPGWYTTLARGDLAVAGFFGLSGYMVAGSYARSPDIRAYMIRRILRIYPGYVVSVIFALLIGLAVSRGSDVPTLAKGAAQYLAANLTFMNAAQSTIPGAFENHIYPTINTAWWTLKIEVAFYIGLPILLYFICGKRGLLWALVFYLLGFAWGAAWGAYSDVHETNFYARMARQLPGWTGYFVIGGLAAMHSDKLVKYRWPALVVSVAILSLGLKTFDLHAPAVVTIVALAAGLVGPHVSLERVGDLSFGVYLYHSPMIQLVIWSGLSSTLGIFGLFGLALAFALILAWLSFHYIEQPANRLAKRLGGRKSRQEEEASGVAIEV